MRDAAMVEELFSVIRSDDDGGVLQKTVLPQRVEQVPEGGIYGVNVPVVQRFEFGDRCGAERWRPFAPEPHVDRPRGLHGAPDVGQRRCRRQDRAQIARRRHVGEVWVGHVHVE